MMLNFYFAPCSFAASFKEPHMQRSVMDQIDAEMRDRSEAARKEGYNAALNDCLGLLRHWFFATNKEARGCEADIRKLRKN